MQLTIIRHCQSTNNALWQETGSTSGRHEDPPLTDRGHRQARVLAAFLARHREQEAAGKPSSLQRAGFAFTHLYCSLMTRSIQTGDYVAEALGLPLVARLDIHERGGIYLENPETGALEGLSGPNRAHFEAAHPRLVLPPELAENGWWDRDYETREAALQRAQTVLDHLQGEHGREDNVALICHGGFTQSLLITLFGCGSSNTSPSGERAIWFKANNGSITRIDIDDRLLRLTYLNFIDFMPAELQT